MSHVRCEVDNYAQSLQPQNPNTHIRGTDPLSQRKDKHWKEHPLARNSPINDEKNPVGLTREYLAPMLCAQLIEISDELANREEISPATSGDETLVGTL